MTAADRRSANQTGPRLAVPSVRSQRLAYRAALLLSDAFMLSLAFGLAYFVRFHTQLSVFEIDIVGVPEFYRRIALLLVPLWLLVMWLAGLYREHNLLGGTREYALVFNTVSVGTLMVVIATFLNPALIIARGWLLVSWLLAPLLVIGARFWLRRVVYLLRRHGWYLSPSLIVGTTEEAEALAEQLTSWQTSGLNVVGFVSGSDDDGVDSVSGLPVLGGLDDIESLVQMWHVEELIIATSSLGRRELVDLFRLFAPRDDVHLRLSSGLFEVLTTGLEVKELAYVPLINVRPVRLSGVDVGLKLLLDYAIAVPVALLGAPLLAVLAILVKLDSPGPVLHRRRVLGLGGRQFDALKLRTMHVDADHRLAQRPDLKALLTENHKLKADPRVTRLGRHLRRLSLDELPQFYNVLRGQMSVVGPRMITAEEHRLYGRWDMNLLTVRPGITGLWQVSGRSDVSYDERVRLDMSYIRNWTIWLDLQILVQTIPAVAGGRGAY